MAGEVMLHLTIEELDSIILEALKADRAARAEARRAQERKRYAEDTEFRARQLERERIRNMDPDVRERKRREQARRQSDAAYAEAKRRKRAERLADPTYRAKVRAAEKARLADPIARERQLAAQKRWREAAALDPEKAARIRESRLKYKSKKKEDKNEQ